MIATSMFVVSKMHPKTEISPCFFIIKESLSASAIKFVSFLGPIPGLEAEIMSKMVKEPGTPWQCTVCLYKGKKIHVFEHVEAKHIIHPGYRCSQCQNVYANRKAFRWHRRNCQ